MTDIYNFIDFKVYLRHYYEEKKKANTHFSYQLLAEKAGFNNKGFVFNIIKGTRKLTKSHCYKLSRALGHTKKEAEYFENIIAYAQARNEEERSYFLKQALHLSGSTGTKTRILGKDQYEYYSIWYHSAIRSLINISPIKDDYERISRSLSSPVTVGQVRKSIQLLDRLGLIAKGKDGFYRLTDKSIRTSREISQTAKNQFHVQCADLAKKAILKDPPEFRNAVSITMGITRNTYKEIVNETESFVNTIINLVKNDDGAPERVYQYELLLFPLSIAGRTE